MIIVDVVDSGLKPGYLVDLIQRMSWLATTVSRACTGELEAATQEAIPNLMHVEACYVVDKY